MEGAAGRQADDGAVVVGGRVTVRTALPVSLATPAPPRYSFVVRGESLRLRCSELLRCSERLPLGSKSTSNSTAIVLDKKNKMKAGTAGLAKMKPVSPTAHAHWHDGRWVNEEDLKELDPDHYDAICRERQGKEIPPPPPGSPPPSDQEDDPAPIHLMSNTAKAFVRTELVTSSEGSADECMPLTLMLLPDELVVAVVRFLGGCRGGSRLLSRP